MPEALDPEDVLGRVCRNAAQLISATPTPLHRMAVRVGDIAVELEWLTVSSSAATVAAAPAAGPAPELRAPELAAPELTASGLAASGLFAPEPVAKHYICAAMVGTVYHAAEPGVEPFVTVGDVVVKGQQVAILESMKLMTPVEADRAGRVVEIVVPDGTPVEYGAQLIALEPT